MVFFNHATRQMTAKIVYYGPGLCGKTTNLNTIYGKTSQKARGEMVSLNTETDRTLFFDLLPMDVGMVGGFKTKLQLYTVPGQVFYNSTRKLVLKGVDGIVFVVDSQTPMLDACKESYQNLEENLRELGLVLGDIPTVFQWNKRDLRNVISVDELEAVFNPKGVPSFQSVASDGTGVFETLRGITKLSLSHIKAHVLGESQVAAPPPPAQVKPARADIEALTLSDLPSVTDLLDLEDTAPVALSTGSVPLPDEDDDSGLFIEAPVLPEHPGTAADEIAFLTDGEEPLPPAALPEGDEQLLPSFEPEPAPVQELQPVQASMPVPPPFEAVPEVVEAPEPASLTEVHATLRPAKVGVKLDPLAALASLKVETKRLPAKPKSVDHKDAINSLMGELTQVGRSGAPSILRLEVPNDVDGQEIEVVVQIRQRGQVLVEGQIRRPAPGKSSTAKLSVEMKRS